MARVYLWKPHEVNLPQGRHLAWEIGARTVNLCKVYKYLKTEC